MAHTTPAYGLYDQVDAGQSISGIRSHGVPCFIFLSKLGQLKLSQLKGTFISLQLQNSPKVIKSSMNNTMIRVYCIQEKDNLFPELQLTRFTLKS
jgi:hypothetical protein